MDNHVVIMAGGIGSRFWPMSTPECPKQFIDVMGCGRSLIQLTADRFDGVCPRENMWVVTSEKYIDIVREQLPEIPESNILAEPCARNTAPCIAFACWKIKKKHPNANVVVTPSDALVIDTGEFRRVMEKALRFTDDGSAIVTIGIRPTRPETGYGYIAAADQLQTADRKLIQTHILILLDTGKGSNVTDLRMLCHRQVLQASTGSNDTILQVLYPESFQILCLKVFQ